MSNSALTYRVRQIERVIVDLRGLKDRNLPVLVIYDDDDESRALAEYNQQHKTKFKSLKAIKEKRKLLKVEFV